MKSAGITAEDPVFHALAQGLQPGVEFCSSFSGRQAFNAPAKFSNGDGTDVEQRFIFPQPQDHLRIRFGFGRFAENVGIN